MLMTDDQRCNEATRLAAQLLLDAQRRASGAPVFATARGEKAPPLARFMREWEKSDITAGSCDLAPHFRPRPIFQNGLR